eukprot:m.975488 g.975488  ORF g.975488 m.975488 type:complete len:807 (+) comp23941_c0_seq2:447-2867(+)
MDSGKQFHATSYVEYSASNKDVDLEIPEVGSDNQFLLHVEPKVHGDQRVLGLGLVDTFGRRAKGLLHNKSTGAFLGRPQRRQGAQKMVHALGEDDYFSRTYIIFWGATMVTYAFLLYTAPDTINQEFSPPDNPWARASYYLLFSIILGVTFVEILRLNRPTSTFLGKLVAIIWIILMNVQAIAAIILVTTDENAKSLYGIQQSVLNAWRLFQIIVADMYALKLLWKLRWRKSKGVKFTPYAARLRDRQRIAVSDAFDGKSTSVLPREPYVKSYLLPQRRKDPAGKDAGGELLRETCEVSNRQAGNDAATASLLHSSRVPVKNHASGETNSPGWSSTTVARACAFVCNMPRRFRVLLHTYYLEEGVFVYPLLTQIAALSTPVLLFWLFIVLLFAVRMLADAVGTLEDRLLSAQSEIAQVNGFVGNLSTYCRDLNQFSANMSNPPLPQQLQTIKDDVCGPRLQNISAIGASVESDLGMFGSFHDLDGAVYRGGLVALAIAFAFALWMVTENVAGVKKWTLHLGAAHQAWLQRNDTARRPGRGWCCRVPSSLYLNPSAGNVTAAGVSMDRVYVRGVVADIRCHPTQLRAHPHLPLHVRHRVRHPQSVDREPHAVRRRPDPPVPPGNDGLSVCFLHVVRRERHLLCAVASGALSARRFFQLRAAGHLAAAKVHAEVRLSVPRVSVGAGAAHAHEQPHRDNRRDRAVLRVLCIATVGALPRYPSGHSRMIARRSRVLTCRCICFQTAAAVQMLDCDGSEWDAGIHSQRWLGSHPVCVCTTGVLLRCFTPWSLLCIRLKIPSGERRRGQQHV